MILKEQTPAGPREAGGLLRPRVLPSAQSRGSGSDRNTLFCHRLRTHSFFPPDRLQDVLLLGHLLCPGRSLLSCRFAIMVALLCPSPFPRRQLSRTPTSGRSALSLGMGLRAPSFLLFPVPLLSELIWSLPHGTKGLSSTIS